MQKKIHQAMGWLNKEMEKDQKEIDAHKRKMIEEIKKLDKSKMFVEKPKEKISIFNKILMILGYGKKR
jgi:hypothetical protein